MLICICPLLCPTLYLVFRKADLPCPGNILSTNPQIIPRYSLPPFLLLLLLLLLSSSSTSSNFSFVYSRSSPSPHSISPFSDKDHLFRPSTLQPLGPTPLRTAIKAVPGGQSDSAAHSAARSAVVCLGLSGKAKFRSVRAI